MLSTLSKDSSATKSIAQQWYAGTVAVLRNHGVQYSIDIYIHTVPVVLHNHGVNYMVIQ